MRRVTNYRHHFARASNVRTCARSVLATNVLMRTHAIATSNRGSLAHLELQFVSLRSCSPRAVRVTFDSHCMARPWRAANRSRTLAPDAPLRLESNTRTLRDDVRVAFFVLIILSNQARPQMFSSFSSQRQRTPAQSLAGRKSRYRAGRDVDFEQHTKTECSKNAKNVHCSSFFIFPCNSQLLRTLRAIARLCCAVQSHDELQRY